MLTAAEAKFLKILDRMLARWDPLLAREEAEAMSAELAALAVGLTAPPKGFDNPSFHDRYGADVTEAATGEDAVFPDAGVTSSDELWLKWWELDRLLGEATDRAHEEARGASDLYEVRAHELCAPILDRLAEVEERIADIIPTTIGDCLVLVRLLKQRWDEGATCEPDLRDDRLVANLLAGVEVMVAAGEPSASG